MKAVLVVLLLIVSGSAFSQVNYVLNPSFEDHSFCPTAYDEIKAANFWSGIDSNAIPNYSCIPEYLNTCSPGYPAVEVPLNGCFWQYPRTGNGMAQMIVFYDESKNPAPFDYYRDFIQGRLAIPLVTNKKYCVSFYVCLEELSEYAIQDIGAYLDNGAIDTVPPCSRPRNLFAPQVVYRGGVIRDTANWTKIEGTFIATGIEQFITIGNFRTKDSTKFEGVPLYYHQHRPNTSNYSWYLVDDVSVIESDLPAYAGPDKHVGFGDSVYIGRPQEVGLECDWTVLGSSTVVGTGAGIWVHPSVTTSYVVTQTLCGQIKKDTVLVEVWAVGVHGPGNQFVQQYALTPNPNNGTFKLVQSFIAEETVRAEICDMLGRKVQATDLHFKDGNAQIQLKNLPAGLYILKIGEDAHRIRFEIR